MKFVMPTAPMLMHGPGDDPVDLVPNARSQARRRPSSAADEHGAQDRNTTASTALPVARLTTLPTMAATTRADQHLAFEGVISIPAALADIRYRRHRSARRSSRLPANTLS